MIPIERLALPAELNDRLSALTQEINTVPAAERQTTADALWRRSGTRTRVHRPLKQALQRMALGLEQCMYCGSDSATDIDHFEPRAKNPLGTFEWLNHLLACGACNSNHKRDRFPTDNDGNPLLINPTVDDPFQHMTLSLSTDVYYPRSNKGTVTIEVCGLNRRLLVDGRRRSRQTVALCLPLWHEAYVAGRDRDMAQIVGTIQQHPFADVCQAMLRQAFAPGAEAVFSDAEVAGMTPRLLVLLRLPALRSALLR